MYRPMMMPHVNGALSGKLPAVQQPKDPIRDSESLAVTYDIMATARLVVDLNTGFAFVRNVENSPLHLTVD